MTLAEAAPIEGKELPHALIALLKGIVERDTDPVLWQALMNHEAGVRDYAAVLGLELRTVEAEGFAYLVQRQAQEGETELPRLIPRRPLSYAVSLMLALLRKRLAEFDALSGESRLVLSREAIHDTIRLFLPESANQVKFADRIDTTIKRCAEMGFLRPLKGEPNQFEVRRILKEFVDARWFGDFAARLEEYRLHAAGGALSGAGAADEDR
jgi:Domain of unknown function (DUF4194)